MSPTMQNGKWKKRRKRVWIIGGVLLVLGISFLVILANFYVEPVLRKRLHTLIIDGSDSLYTYQLGGLEASFFGGKIEVTNLQLKVDSARYRVLLSRHALPSMVMQVNVQRASIKGIGIFSLLFNKKILVDEIYSGQADIHLLRNFRKEDSSTAVTENKLPLWRALQPAINDIAVDKIKLDGIKLLYRNTGGEDAAELQFNRCDAEIDNIRIDSASVADTSRIGYVENFSLRFTDIRFVTSDSSYKMNAERVAYNTKDRLLQVDSFILQPTLEKYQRYDSIRKSYYTVTFDRVNFLGLRLDRYLRFNRAEADSIIFRNPKLAIYQDKAGEKLYKSKIGHYPHQQLLNTDAIIAMKKFVAENMTVEITEKHAETREEGTIRLDKLDISVENIVNDPALIRQNPVSTARAHGRIIGSPIQAEFRFYLDSAEGRFDMKGSVQNVSAAQLNPISTRLANIVVPSMQISTLNFLVRGEDFGATAEVEMRYSNLALIFRKRDEETGVNKTRGFLTRILNRYVINPANPINGEERKASDVKVARLSTQSFFGVIWKAVFQGMQQIMIRQG